MSLGRMFPVSAVFLREQYLCVAEIPGLYRVGRGFSSVWCSRVPAEGRNIRLLPGRSATLHPRCADSLSLREGKRSPALPGGKGSADCPREMGKNRICAPSRFGKGATSSRSERTYVFRAVLQDYLEKEPGTRQWSDPGQSGGTIGKWTEWELIPVFSKNSDFGLNLSKLPAVYLIEAGKRVPRDPFRLKEKQKIEKGEKFYDKSLS